VEQKTIRPWTILTSSMGGDDRPAGDELFIIDTTPPFFVSFCRRSNEDDAKKREIEPPQPT
jgi:hypothetical protein